MLSYASNTFDPVIANRKLKGDAEYDLRALLERRPFIRQAVVFDSTPAFTRASRVVLPITQGASSLHLRAGTRAAASVIWLDSNGTDIPLKMQFS